MCYIMVIVLDGWSELVMRVSNKMVILFIQYIYFKSNLYTVYPRSLLHFSTAVAIQKWTTDICTNMCNRTMLSWHLY